MASSADHRLPAGNASLHPGEPDLRKVAQILKSNGTDGEIVMGFRGISPEDISTEDPVFIFFDGLPVPFFIESFIRKGQNKALVRLTDIRTYADAQEISGQGVYMDSADLDMEDDEDFSMLTGWALLQEDGTPAGTVTGYLDIPGNPCLSISVSGQEENGNPREVIVPLHEDLIISVDSDSREITMSLPSGLI